MQLPIQIVRCRECTFWWQIKLSSVLRFSLFSLGLSKRNRKHFLRVSIEKHSWKFGRTRKSRGNTRLRLVFPQHFSFSQKLMRVNGRFARSCQMVQNLPCWMASYALGHPKQREVTLGWWKSLCFGGCCILLPSRMADFVPCVGIMQKAHSNISRPILKIYIGFR